MKLPSLGVKRPITTLMIFIGILMIGIISFSRLKMDLFPDISVPSISIITVYPGANAEDIEDKVSKVIENGMNSVNNIDEIYSTSKANISIVTLKFNWDADMSEALNDVRSALDFVKIDLPDDANEPIVFKFDVSMAPIIFFGVTAKESANNLHYIVQKKIVDKLKHVKGVGTVTLIGGREKQINIKIDLDVLKKYNLTIDDVKNAIKGDNFTYPGGDIESGEKIYLLKIDMNINRVDELNSIVIGNFSGHPIYLQDVAEVEYGYKDYDRFVNVNGNTGMLFFISKQSGANIVELSRQVRNKIKIIEKELPKDVKVSLLMDTSKYIVDSINTLGGSVIWGGLFVILVVFFFLRNIKGSLIISLTIPFSLIVAFIFMYAMGYTINTMSLSSLAIAIGMVVDNGIVILENIYRHVSRGEKVKEASIFASDEVGMAITASTITTITIFFPLVFVTGFVGVIFKQLGAVITVVLLASLFTSLTLMPMLTSKLLKRVKRDEKKSFLYRITEKIFVFIENIYSKLIAFSLRFKWGIVLLAIVIFGLTMYRFVPLMKTEFFPVQDSGNIEGTVEISKDANKYETVKIMQQIEKYLKEIPEMQIYFWRCGQSSKGFASAMGQKEGDNFGRFTIKLTSKKERNRSSEEIAYELRKKLKTIPGILKLDITTEDMMMKMMSGMGNAKPIVVELYGEDLDVMRKYADEIVGILNGINGLYNVSNSYSTGKPEVVIKIDREKAATEGVPIFFVASAIRNYIYGTNAGVYKDEGNDIDINIRLKKSQREFLDDISKLYVRNIQHQLVPIDQLISWKIQKSVLEINRKQQEKVITIEANMINRTLSDVKKELTEKLAKLSLPAAMSIKLSGNIENQRSSFADLSLMMLIGIILVYMVMASQFESLFEPFIIMFSIPFAFIGVVLGLYITQQTFNVASFVGVIMLVGIVVNNAIVYIDYSNILHKRGYNRFDSLVEAGRTRLRPILMTATTTIFGLLPLALSKGEGSESWVPLAVTVISGLLVSTLITLILIPSIYYIFKHDKKKIKEAK